MAQTQSTTPDSNAALAPSAQATTLPEPDTTAPDPAQPAPALGKTVGRGMVWLVASNILTKGASFITFALVAGVLKPSDIGLWTMAFSFAAFTQFFRDGGVSQLLIQRGAKQYDALAGPIFWLALLFNLATALVLATLAPFAAGPNWYDQPELKKLLWVMAATIPFTTASTIWWAKIQADLRFGALSRITLGTSLIRYGGTIAGAYAGLGPMSFVLPLPIAALYEIVVYYWTVRDKPWSRAPKPEMWWPLFNEGKWLVFSALAFAVVNQGPYFLIGKVINAEQLGIFAFASQLVGQIDQFLAATTAIVLLPALARLNDEPERRKAATLRAARVMMVLATGASLGLLVLVDPLQRLIWGQTDWTRAAVQPAQIIALAFAWRVLLWVPAPALQAMGLFRFSAMLALVTGLLLTACAVIGAKLGNGDLSTIAWWVTGCNAIGFLAMSLWGMARMGVAPTDVLKGTVPTWLCGALAAAIALVQFHLAHPLITATLHDRLAAGCEIAITGTLFTAITYLLLKLLVPSALKELGAMLPARAAFLKRYL